MTWVWKWVAVAMVRSSWVTGLSARIARGAATGLSHPVQPAPRGAECDGIGRPARSWTVISGSMPRHW